MDDDVLCKICYESNGNFVSICQCKGSMKWTHEKCIKEWIKISNVTKCTVCSFEQSVIVKRNTWYNLLHIENVIVLFLTILLSSYWPFLSLWLVDFIKEIFLYNDHEKSFYHPPEEVYATHALLLDLFVCSIYFIIMNYKIRAIVTNCLFTWILYIDQNYNDDDRAKLGDVIYERVFIFLVLYVFISWVCFFNNESIIIEFEPKEIYTSN